MHRLFVALRPPAAAIDRLLDLQGGVEGARWQDEEQIHLTLRFIGEVERHRAEDIAVALGQVRAQTLDLGFGQLGSFDRKGRIDALWIGVGPGEPLAHLHRKIDQAVVRCGLPPERRAFVPHVTLARLGRSAPPLPVLPPVPADLPAWHADAFWLFESHLGRAGAHYDPVERYRLG